MHRPILFSRKAWIFDPDEDPNDILQKVNQFACRTEKYAYEQIFANRSAAEFVYSSNLMEKTLPVGFSEHATFTCLEDIFQQTETDEISSSWNADGSRNQSEMKNQMVQHCRALHLVSSWSRDTSHRLSAELVCSLHKTLMHNATDANGSLLLAGEIRKGGIDGETGTSNRKVLHESGHERSFSYFGCNTFLRSHSSTSIPGWKRTTVAPASQLCSRSGRISICGPLDIRSFKSPKALYFGNTECTESRCDRSSSKQTLGRINRIDLKKLLLQDHQF